jgi:hypothetical protein
VGLDEDHRIGACKMRMQREHSARRLAAEWREADRRRSVALQDKTNDAVAKRADAVIE